jgi:hypothetical protein
MAIAISPAGACHVGLLLLSVWRGRADVHRCVWGLRCNLRRKWGQSRRRRWHTMPSATACVHGAPSLPSSDDGNDGAAAGSSARASWWNGRLQYGMTCGTVLEETGEAGNLGSVARDQAACATAFVTFYSHDIHIASVRHCVCYIICTKLLLQPYQLSHSLPPPPPLHPSLSHLRATVLAPVRASVATLPGPETDRH